jgi:hypothetical protein
VRPGRQRHVVAAAVAGPAQGTAAVDGALAELAAHLAQNYPHLHLPDDPVALHHMMCNDMQQQQWRRLPPPAREWRSGSPAADVAELGDDQQWQQGQWTGGGPWTAQPGGAAAASLAGCDDDVDDNQHLRSTPAPPAQQQQQQSFTVDAVDLCSPSPAPLLQRLQLVSSIAVLPALLHGLLSLGDCQLPWVCWKQLRMLICLSLAAVRAWSRSSVCHCTRLQQGSTSNMSFASSPVPVLQVSCCCFSCCLRGAL